MRYFSILFLFLFDHSQAQFISTTWESTWIGGTSFSSVRATDLNNDDVDDIVVGAGIEDAHSDLGIIAINGATGDTLWTKASRNQIYSSVIFATSEDSLNKLVYLAGRDAQLLCLNGSDGNTIWEFWPDNLGSPESSGWLNFYNPRFLGNDNIIVTNGGLASASSGDPNRPPGKLLIIDRFDGTILFQASMPDSSETYFAPMIWPLSEEFGGELIVVGSGGETLPGSLYTQSLEAFKIDGLSTAIPLLQDNEKGFIQATAFADLNADGEYDMLVPRVNNGGLIALDGLTKEVIWSFELPNSENYTSPVIADFTGDGLPDVFSIFGRGEFPIYFNYLAHLIDGQSGLSIYSESLPLNQFNAGNALDWDRDGTDEILLIQNKSDGSNGLKHAFKIIDFNNDTSYFVSEFMSGNVAFPTPLIRDIDNDGFLEILYVFNPQADPRAEVAMTAFGRFDLDLPAEDVAWGGYLGTFEDGTYRDNLNDSSKSALDFDLNIFPNPASNQLRIINRGAAIDVIQIFNPLGKNCDVDFEKIGKNYLINTSPLSPGLYLLRFSDRQKLYTEKVLIE